MSPASSKKKSKSEQSTTRPEDWRYEETVTQIESIIDQIETGALELEDVFEQFSLAMTYLQQCDQFLNERQAQMDLLIETLGDGSSQWSTPNPRA